MTLMECLLIIIRGSTEPDISWEWGAMGFYLIFLTGYFFLVLQILLGVLKIQHIDLENKMCNVL